MRIWLFCGLLLICGSALPQETVSGVWRIHRARPDDTFQDTYLNLKQEGKSVTGDIIENYNPTKVVKGSYRHGVLRLETNPWREIRVIYAGPLRAGNLNLTITEREKPGAKAKVTKVEATPSTDAAIRPPAPLPIPEVHEVPDNALVRTPPMGWNSWNHFAEKVTDATVRDAADAIVSTGLKDAGYIYVNIDDTWESSRDASGNIQTNRKFPDMKALADYVHSKGLKIGIYSSPGPFTCGGYEGSYGHEEQDAKTYASWGIDYLKYDWCSAGAIYKDSDLRAVYQKMGDALQATGRPIVFSLCEYGRGDVWTWGSKVGGNLWRTTGDIEDSWKSLEEIGFSQGKIAEYVQPGHWNDPDMLEVGNGGMTDDEYRTHMSLWALLSAPLLAGNDLHKMSKSTLDILTNRDVIAVDQDTAVHHPKQSVLEGKTEMWTREMADGSTIVALFNREDQPKQMGFQWADVASGSATKARDLWKHEDVTVSGPSYSANVPRHGVVMLRVWGKS